MKLATLKNSNRDGELVLVSSNNQNAIEVGDIAPTLQYALDNWTTKAPLLQKRYEELNAGILPEAFGFESQNLESPLPRSYRTRFQYYATSANHDENTYDVI